MPKILDGANSLQAILSYGPIMYGNPETGTLISLDLYSKRWIWWTRVGTSEHWTPEVSSPADEPILKWAESLVEYATQWHKEQTQ